MSSTKSSGSPERLQSLERYHRQMLLPGFGEEGQRRLLDSTVFLVGCGALGSVSANLLARAGVGHLVICDRDFVELTNLQRQVLFEEEDAKNSVPKAEAAKAKIAKINSDVQVTSIVDDLNHTNIEEFVQSSEWGPVDLILDGVDNFETRYLANDVAVKYSIPYVYGGAVGTVGLSFAVLPYTPSGNALWEEAGKATPCLRCIFEQAPPAGMSPTCDTAGVLGSTVSLIANYQVGEALKILTQNWEAVNSQMFRIDSWENQYRGLKVEKCYELGSCECCKERGFPYLEGKHASSTTTLCGRNAVQFTNKLSSSAKRNGERGESVKVDLEEVGSRLAAHGKVQVTKYLLRTEVQDGGLPYELTLFTDGRAIVKGTKDPNVAKGIYAKYIGI